MQNILFFLVLLCCIGSAGASALTVVSDAEQTDPISGLRWRRVSDPGHPTVPPRLKLSEESGSISAEHRQARPAPCVRAGDHLILRSASGPSSLALDATALQNSACGDHARARIVVTGALVRITVLSQREGVLDGNGGSWR